MEKILFEADVHTLYIPDNKQDIQIFINWGCL